MIVELCEYMHSTVCVRTRVRDLCAIVCECVLTCVCWISIHMIIMQKDHSCYEYSLACVASLLSICLHLSASSFICMRESVYVFVYLYACGFVYLYAYNHFLFQCARVNQCQRLNIFNKGQWKIARIGLYEYVYLCVYVCACSTFSNVFIKKPSHMWIKYRQWRPNRSVSLGHDNLGRFSVTTFNYYYYNTTTTTTASKNNSLQQIIQIYNFFNHFISIIIIIKYYFH